MVRPLILLTGASGFIGSHLARALAPERRLRCLVRPGSESRVPRHPNIEVVPMDLMDAPALEGACDGAAVIIHAAALLRKAAPEDIFKINAELTERLAAAAVKTGAGHFIFFSSENALRTDLTDAYPESKRRGEAAVRALRGHLILRPCFVYGPGDHHGVGRLADLARTLPVVPLFGGLKAKVQPIYIDDLVTIVLRAVELRIEGEYTIAGPDAADLNTIALLICRTRGLHRLLLPVPKFLWRAAALAGSCIPGAGWGPAQFDNIYDARFRDPEPALRAFGCSARGLEAGLLDWAVAERGSMT